MSHHNSVIVLTTNVPPVLGELLYTHNITCTCVIMLVHTGGKQISSAGLDKFVFCCKSIMVLIVELVPLLSMCSHRYHTSHSAWCSIYGVAVYVTVQ